MDKTRVDRAVMCFSSGFSCSQAILSTYAEQLGLDRCTALKVSGAFGGGMARMGDTCGAVTGAFMAIGLKHGNTELEDEESKTRTYAVVREFVERFKATHTSIVCRELLGCEIGTPEGKQMFDARSGRGQDTRRDSVTGVEPKNE